MRVALEVHTYVGRVKRTSMDRSGGRGGERDFTLSLLL